MTDEIRFDNLMYLDQNLVSMVTPTIGDPNTSMGIEFGEANLPFSCSSMSDFHPICDSTYEDSQQEDPDFSNAILSYINQILMEETEDKDCMVQGSMELQVAEKSFYEVIGKRYPPSPNQNFDSSGEYLGCFSNSYSSDSYVSTDVRFGDSSALENMNWPRDLSSEGFESMPVYQNSQSTLSSVSCISSIKNDLAESPTSNSTPEVPDLYSGSQSVSLFIKGVEEAKKLIPNTDELIVSPHMGGLQKKSNGQCSYPAATIKMYDELKGKKHRNRIFTELEEEERSGKQVAVNPDDSNVHSDIFDEILLNHAGDQNKAVHNLRETLKNESIKKMQLNGQSKGPGSRKKQSRKKVVDLRTLLINCAQAVTSGDQRRANELLIQIKQNSSPFGDGNQRLAHCLADGLEARLAGNGSLVYRNLVSINGISSTAILKAYLVYLAACPFRKVSNIFSNRTISKLTQSATKIHIIDFGILYGFQWPTFIQRQSERPGGPPKIRITGVDFPQPGFRPAQRVEETGRRLSHYAKEFGVPFEFNPIAKRWEFIRLEDLKIEEDEVVIVNCIYRMKNLPDETMVADCSRNAIFKMIRQINPAVFIQGVVNGAYNAPFFLTRFREALFHFSAFFDMLETVMPRESEERMLIEREILGREALNVVACEGWERVERPETYKQWQARNFRAGFLPLPIDQQIKDRASLRVKAYHKEFVIGQDGHWLLLGWKGRIVYALSTWKPA